MEDLFLMDKPTIYVLIALILISGYFAFSPTSIPQYAGSGMIFLIISVYILCRGLYKNKKREGKLII